MSRGRNNIRGPTSALTEFLRESGINPATIARRAATQPQPQPEAGPSNATTGEESNQANASSSSSSRPTRAATRAGRQRASGYASDNLDEDEGEEEEDASEEEEEPESEDSPAPAKKRKLTKAAEAKLKAQQNKKGKAKSKGKKGKGGGDEDDYDDDDPYTSLSKSMWNNAGPKPPAGSFENCFKCGKQFTVTKYTLAAKPGPGWICHVCAKASGQDPFKKAATSRKRKANTEKREVIHFVESRLPSLVSLCIKLLTKYIDDVESLGDIGTLNMDAISKAISKSRSLTSENARLFYNTTNSKLTFYDATNLASSALETLVFLNPNLTSLRLDFCGQLDDDAFKAFTNSLPALQRIELLGPFLVRAPSWKAFAKAHPNLEGFLITQSPRFDLECIRALVKHCPGLKELRLREFGKMSDVFLEEISALGQGLTYLDISCPGESCSEAAVISLLSEVGASLRHLDVSKHDLLGARFLSHGLLQHTQDLESLCLSHLPDLADADVASLFKQWANPPLVHLDLSRNHELKTEALKNLMKHSGKRLESLNINGWKDAEEAALRVIGQLGKELKKIDVGFCREMDDFVVKAWLEGDQVGKRANDGCKNLKELKVWGCNKITAKCPRKSGVAIHGVEFHIIR